MGGFRQVHPSRKRVGRVLSKQLVRDCQIAQRWRKLRARGGGYLYINFIHGTIFDHSFQTKTTRLRAV